MSFVDTSADIIGDLASPYALIAQAGRSIGGIVPNVVIQETISDENVITSHPVQSGTPVSDHVFAAPVVVDMLVGWSDSTGGYPGYVQDVYQMLLSLRDTRQPFDVYTGKRMFSNMLFGNMTPTTDETSEYALMLRVRLQEVIISDTSTTGTSPSADTQAQPQQTGPETNVGTQSLQSTGTESETAASAKAATIAGYQTPVTTPTGSAGIGSA